jgi:peptidoglycan-N-acetylglucosamine deacetylase
VYLTFDDGPDPVWTPRILAALRNVDARATFFVVAPLARRYPRLVQGALSLGHGVELHCTLPLRHIARTRHEVEADTRIGLRNLRRVGARPALLRPPWGVLAPWSGAVASECGLRPVLWSADTHDWRGDTAAEMLEAVMPALGPGAVVLMHDGLGPGARRSGCGETIALVEELVQRIRAARLEPATLPSNATEPAMEAPA